MTKLSDTDIGSGSLRFAKDYVGVDYHNDGHSHIDALCHVAYEGSLYNGLAEPRPSTGPARRPRDRRRSRTASSGRGVLLDIPRLRGLPWIEPGDHIYGDELEAAEREQGVARRAGDILLVRTGHRAGSTSMGMGYGRPEGGTASNRRALLRRSGIAALGSDGNSDTAPSSTEGVAFPIHVLALNAMGVHLLDYLQLEELAAACERERRWEFLFVAAPLRIPGGTGSPLNPVAIL